MAVEFQDPLENFEPKTYADPLEEALAEKSVAAIQHEPFATISPETSIDAAVQKLDSLQVACLLVTENEDLVGVFSDRDVLNRVALDYEQLKDHPVREVMTKDPVFVYETDSAATTLSVMAVSGYRHVPVVGIDGRVCGIVSPQRVTTFLQAHFPEKD